MNYCIGNGQVDQLNLSQKVGALNCMHDQQAVLLGGGTSLDDKKEDVVMLSSHKQHFGISQIGTGTTLTAQEKEIPIISKKEGDDRMDTAVRRLTPLECERLQGFPDNWTLIGEPEENKKTGETEYFYTDTNGKRKKVSDSARYKALGNTIALPFWQFLARRIVAQYERDITMGSLFDGISGFPLVFRRCGAKPLWTSEIEEFPIAVCKTHFGDEDAKLDGDVNKFL